MNRHYNFGTAHDQYFFSDIPVQDKFTIAYGKTADGKCPHFLYYKGLIDDVRIYDIPLSADEIKEIYSYNGDESPSNPIINGPSNGKAGVSYTYTFTSIDPNGDNISYYIEWGDGDITNWSDFQSSGPLGYNENHTWNQKGKYTIKAKAQDTYGEESGWGTLTVTMPRNKPFNFNFNLLSWLFERFPNAFTILRYILELQ